MEHQGVTLGVVEEGHLAHAGVVFAAERDATRLEVAFGFGHVLDPEGHGCGVRGEWMPMAVGSTRYSETLPVSISGQLASQSGPLMSNVSR